MEIFHIAIPIYSQTGKCSHVCNTNEIIVFNCVLRRSFFSSTIQNSSANKIDTYIKKLDYDVRRMGRITIQEIEIILKEINISSECFLKLIT